MNYLDSINQDKDVNRDYGRDVDSLIRLRDRAKIDLLKSRMALLEMGVKTEKDGKLNSLPGLDESKFYDWGETEFAWEAEYEDGKIIKQFDGETRRHYGNIDQSRLRKISWVSGFEYATDNQERRVIVTMDFQKGTFEFLNGFCPQDVRAVLLPGYPEVFEPKLILKVIKRISTSLSYPDGAVEERSFYNRYLLGWEGTAASPTKEKRIVCIEPNGFIHLWPKD